MIRGLHGLFYSSDPEATRAFLRDQLRLPFTDTGGGWLIFDLPESDLGVHPIDESGRPAAGTHDVSFYCNDIAGTIADLRAHGVELADAADHGYGFVTYFKMPGGIEVQLYEPKYQKATSVTRATNGVAKGATRAKPATKKSKPAKRAVKPTAKRRAKPATKRR